MEEHMKRSVLVFAGLILVLVNAAFASAQNATEQRQLKEYVNPPSIKAVDTVFMEDMTWLELRSALKAGKTTVILPAGGLEASGPFLTLNKHQNMLRGSTELIARKLGNALVAPVIKYVPPDEPVGVRGDYLGDFSISVPTYKATLVDICTNLMNDGFKDIILIGDHQGAQRGMKEVSDELATTWAGGPAKVRYVGEYYDRTAVNNYVKTTLGITEKSAGLGDNYYNTSILMAVEPSGARLKERTEGKQLTVNGVNLEPIQKTIENGKKILEMQADQTVKAIQKAIAGGK
jgi:creatinine amidohydrolase/Fe(II)-dependent formamide hydrolase-like protein